MANYPRDPNHPHLVNGEFQSDKYPTCPPGKVPLSCKDPTAQDLLWEYAQRRRAVDAEFAVDLELALKDQGFVPPPMRDDEVPGESSRELRGALVNMAIGHDRQGQKLREYVERYRAELQEVRDALCDYQPGYALASAVRVLIAKLQQAEAEAAKLRELVAVGTPATPVSDGALSAARRPDADPQVGETWEVKGVADMGGERPWAAAVICEIVSPPGDAQGAPASYAIAAHGFETVASRDKLIRRLKPGHHSAARGDHVELELETLRKAQVIWNDTGISRYARQERVIGLLLDYLGAWKL